MPSGFYVVDSISAQTRFWSSIGDTVFDETPAAPAEMFPLKDEADLFMRYPPPELSLIEIEVPVTFDNRAQVSFSLRSEVSLSMTNVDEGDNFDVLAEAQFGNTAALTLAEVFDDQGVKLTDATIHSESGIDYLGAPVPKTPTGMLAGLALICIVVASERTPFGKHRLTSIAP